MAKHELRRTDVVRKRSDWVAERKSGCSFATGSTKQAVVKNAAKEARGNSRPLTLRIHGRDGRVQAERTSPRSADPRSSKG